MKTEAQNKKKTTYGVDAVEDKTNGGLLALYWAPGISPGYVRDVRTGKPVSFNSVAEAVSAGAKRLFDVLNAPRSRVKTNNGKRERYERLTGPEFAELLSASGLTLTFFAYLYGTSEKRVFGWIDGVNEKGDVDLAPHNARVMLELFKSNNENINIAEQITDEVTTPRHSKQSS